MPVDEQQQPLAGQQIVGHQRAGGFAPHQHDVALFHPLQAGGQRAVRHLDAEELQHVLVVGAGHAVGAQQRPAVDLEAEHGELAVLEAEPGVAGGGEGEQRVGPVMNGEDLLLIDGAHFV